MARDLERQGGLPLSTLSVGHAAVRVDNEGGKTYRRVAVHCPRLTAMIYSLTSWCAVLKLCALKPPARSRL
jgi:hypothetical protein